MLNIFPKILFIVLGQSLLFNLAIADEHHKLSVGQAITQALDKNPDLASMNASFLALSKAPVQAAALPDPMLRFNVVNIPVDSFALDQTPMSQIQIGISQTLPFPGKLALKSEVATNIAEASNANWLDAKRKIVLQIRHLWWQMFFLNRSLEITEQNFSKLEQFIEVAETKYSVGQGLQQDVLLAQVEVHKLQDKKLQLISSRQFTQANLNRLMGNASDHAIDLNESIDKELPVLKNQTEYLTQARQSRPDLKRANAMSATAASRFQLAKKDYYPDFQLAALYGWRQDQADLANVLFSVNIPWDTQHRYNPAKDQRNQEWMQQKYAITALDNQIDEDIEIAMANFQRATQQYALFSDTIIPQAEQIVETMLASYQVSKVTFLDLLRAQITLFNYETQYWQAFTTAKQSLAALDAAVGQEYSHE